MEHTDINLQDDNLEFTNRVDLSKLKQEESNVPIQEKERRKQTLSQI